MKIKVLLFAHLRELAETAQLQLDLPDNSSAQDLLNTLAEQSPSLAPALESSRLAINQSYVQDLSQQLQETDEVALIPPVSGG